MGSFSYSHALKYLQFSL